ncbi:hypothetical protein DYBT9275_04561 [Dyadobacter sp. CECT 9275]|uniref:Uncharacterized protein n=1 Tax=Dyadobacter helix TaxID=2822344 RepID=A0A916JEN3_9BACT|nr:hypothetical protein [Dyadobacter sp. CECT 9275]CAG5009745.1 hypothetical protein DYBT9275_04561 [Dyadobacter sp. CECT 9275]
MQISLKFRISLVAKRYWSGHNISGSKFVYSILYGREQGAGTLALFSKLEHSERALGTRASD